MMPRPRSPSSSRIPHLGELSQRAGDSEGVRIGAFGILSYRLLDRVVIGEPELRLRKRGEIPFVAFYLRRRFQRGQDISGDERRIEFRRNGQPEFPCPLEKRQKVDAVPCIGAVLLEGPSIVGDRLTQRVTRDGTRLVRRIEEYLLVDAAEKTRDLDLLGVIGGQALSRSAQHVGGGRCVAGFDESLRVELAILRVTHIQTAYGFRQLGHLLPLADIAQACDQLLGCCQIVRSRCALELP